MTEHERDGLVSAVIPTLNRPDLVLRAIASVAAQTHSPLEIVVVVDGPDPATIEALAGVNDPRLKVVPLPRRVGGAEARNAGVREACGEWIAFLDDDDQWFPGKLEKQMALARSVRARYPVVACRLVAKGPAGEWLWPRRLPRPDEPVGEYLFERRSPFQGETLVQTSMLLAPRELFLALPFRKIPRHQDWDWLLRAGQVPGFMMLFEATPQLFWFIDEARSRISTRTGGAGWAFSMEWVAGHRDVLSPAAYAGFLLTVVADLAKKEGDVAGFRAICAEAFRNGRPSLRCLALTAAIMLFPKHIRQRIRGLFLTQTAQEF